MRPSIKVVVVWALVTIATGVFCGVVLADWRDVRVVYRDEIARCEFKGNVAAITYGVIGWGGVEKQLLKQAAKLGGNTLVPTGPKSGEAYQC